MKSPLQILLLEDSESDAALIAHELKAGGLHFRLGRIESEAELRRELELHQPDIILSDHGLLTFSGFRALEIVRQVQPTLPFVFVSGSNDQQMIVDMYERGATDYVFKNDIHDLVPAVRHALEEHQDEAVTSVLDEPFHPELPLNLPAPPPQSATRPYGRLIFCPQCGIAHDDTGNVANMPDYFARCVEVTVVRQLCGHCAS